MGVTSDVYPPSQEGESGEEERSARKWLGQPQNKHSLCLPSCKRTEGSGYSQQGTKFVSCLIFPIAKLMPVSALLTQAPEKRGEKFNLHINVPSSLSLLRRDYSPGGLRLLKFPHVQLYVRSGRGCGESFLNSPQVLWVGQMTPEGGRVTLMTLGDWLDFAALGHIFVGGDLLPASM